MTDSESRFQAAIRSGASVLVVEVTPPATGDAAPLRASAKRFAGKVHAVGVDDNRHGVAMSSLAAAAVLASEGVEPIMHVVTRDRNRVALLSACLGAKALGVGAVLCTSGTHQTLGVCKPAKNVYDIDSVQAISAVAKLDSLCVGGVASPFADPLEMQLIKTAKKVSAGAQFLITSPVFDVARFQAWWAAASERGLPGKVAILAGIQPLLDADAAKAFAASRPAPGVPAAMLETLAAAGGKDAQRAAGIAAAVETIKQLSQVQGVRGFQISSDGDDDAVLEIIQRAGLEAR